MTTEIAVLNAEAVALASDSAATYAPRGGTSQGKIHTSANKIFALSDREPVAVMIYGSAAFASIPWETIVKMFRREIGDTSEAHLLGYADRLVEYLGRRGFASDGWQERFVETTTATALEAVREDLVTALTKRLDDGSGGVSAADVEAMLIEEIAKRRANEERVDPIHDDHASAVDSFGRRYRSVIEGQVVSTFPGLPLGDASRSATATLIAERMLRQNALPGASGVVIAGFGDEDLLPCLTHLRVDGAVDGRVRAWEGVNSWDVATMGPKVLPFAQDDMANFFLTGVSPKYQELVDTLIKTVLTGYPDQLIEAAGPIPAAVKKRLLKARDNLAVDSLSVALGDLEVRRMAVTDQTLTIVRTLPKDQLASLAEALVNLTKLRRRLTPGPETVGGPVDVAVISKGDGLIWVSRKHYFDPALNPRYFANAFGRP